MVHGKGGSMKTIVLGKGFLGKKFEQMGYEVWGKERFHPRMKGPSQLARLVNYDVVINCMAKANTRWCEKPENFREALWVNGDVPHILSAFCKAQGKKFVHISTGCLYDSGSHPYAEDDSMTAHCNYTITKWVGEKGLNEGDLVLRPRLLFGDFADKGNLLCKLPTFTHYLNAFNSYISVSVLVEAITALLNKRQSGVFNVACDGISTVTTLASTVGLKGIGITEEELHEREQLYLVNNIMNLDKLKQFYQPPSLITEVKRCWEALKCAESY